MGPRVSVVIRSFNRLGALCELVTLLLAQDHESFELVVVEQSTQRDGDAAGQLIELARDPRVRVLQRPPLGGARARNVGVEHARGEIVVFIDDDDLPIGTDFLTSIERPFREDPRCMGVTCRHQWGTRGEISRAYRFQAGRRCMRFSSLLRLPRTYARHDRRVHGVDYVHGTGGAYRRSVLERFGGWDEDTPIEDETSLGIRIGRGLVGGEYLAFDPRARLLRRMDLDGGLAKRHLTSAGFYRKFMTFVHHIIGRYYPVRTRVLYLGYVVTGLQWTIDWIWNESCAHHTVLRRIAGTLAVVLLAPWLLISMLGVPMGSLPGSGAAVASRLRTGPTLTSQVTK